MLIKKDPYYAKCSLNKTFWNDLIEIYNDLRVDGWISDNAVKSKSIAAALFYVRCLRNKIDLTQRDIAEIACINENTLREVSKKMPGYVLRFSKASDFL